VYNFTIIVLNLSSKQKQILMKKTMISFLLVLIGFSAFSQVDVFASKDMVFYGLDFTKARFDENGGTTAFVSPASMQDKYFPALNELMINERKKYDVAKSYKKENVEYYFDMSDEFNADFDVYDSFVDDDEMVKLTEEQITEIVAKYKDDSHSGLGLVYVVDLVNHQRNTITIQIAFFDISTGETLLVKKARGTMKGFSIRNYYAGGIYQIIKESAKTYKKWSKGK
jgi:hypothetical protein